MGGDLYVPPRRSNTLRKTNTPDSRVVVQRRFVLVDLVLRERAQAARRCGSGEMNIVWPRSFGPHSRPSSLKLSTKLWWNCRFFDVAEEGEVVVVGELAPGELDVLVHRLVVLQDDLVRRRAAILHVRPRVHGAASPRKAECVTRMFFEAFTSSPGKPPKTVRWSRSMFSEP